MKRDMATGWKLVAVFLVSILLQPWVALGADITPGYTFSSGEANVTHTKLNNSAAGTINTSFFSGKSSAGSSPNTAFEILLRDTSLDTYKKTTIAALLDHSSLIDGRSVVTSPGMGFLWLVSDSGAYKAISMTNAAFGANLTAPTNETRLGFVNAGGTLTSLTLSNLLGGATAQTEATNTDRYLVLSGLDSSVKGITAGQMIAGAVPGTNFDGNHIVASFDGTRLRSNRATNLIDGVTVTNTPATNAAFVVLQDGALEKLFLDSLRTFIMSNAARHYVLIRQTNSSGSNGQTLTAANGWETRTLNDEHADTGNVATLASSQIELTPGVYRARITAPCHECGSHQARWVQVDGSATNLVILGTTMNSTASSGVTTDSLMAGRFTVVTNTLFEVQHNVGDNGLGGQAGSHGQGEVYTVVELWKESE